MTWFWIKKNFPIQIHKESVAIRWSFMGSKYSFFYGFNKCFVSCVPRTHCNSYYWIDLSWKSAGLQTKESKALALLSEYSKHVDCPACGKWGSKKKHNLNCRLVKLVGEHNE